MKITNLDDLFLDQLQDMHSSERQIIKALPKMAKAATNPDLKKAFTHHLEETKVHLERLDKILNGMEKSSGRKVCKATVGLIEEGAEMIDVDAEPDARDAGLICTAQKIEHYEIASYGCLHCYAMTLGRTADADLLELTLSEEKHADVALTTLATSEINSEAMKS